MCFFFPFFGEAFNGYTTTTNNASTEATSSKLAHLYMPTGINHQLQKRHDFQRYIQGRGASVYTMVLFFFFFFFILVPPIASFFPSSFSRVLIRVLLHGNTVRDLI